MTSSRDLFFIYIVCRQLGKIWQQYWHFLTSVYDVLGHNIGSYCSCQIGWLIWSTRRTIISLWVTSWGLMYLHTCRVCRGEVSVPEIYTSYIIPWFRRGDFPLVDTINLRRSFQDYLFLAIIDIPVFPNIGHYTTIHVHQCEPLFPEHLLSG